MLRPLRHSDVACRLGTLQHGGPQAEAAVRAVLSSDRSDPPCNKERRSGNSGAEMYRMRSSAVRLCLRGEALCPRGGAGPPARGQEGSARRASRCRPETSSWRTPQTPVNQGTTPKPFRGGLQISACADTNLNTHYCRTSPWLSPNGNPQVNPALLRGGPGWPVVHVQPLHLRGGPGWPGVHVQPLLLLRGGPGWPAVHLQPLLRSSGARGLCSGKSRPPQDTDPSPEQNESQGSSVHVPGHGLFKFKELVCIRQPTDCSSRTGLDWSKG